ncbi:MAG: DNA ligase D [Candidatus Binataceae bacterium]
MPLEKYRSKRSADRTPEPLGGLSAAQDQEKGGIFVIQQHDARNMHYDFRLEMDGVLRSWAVPKGPSLNSADKRLAMMVEDHPLEYGDFEGIIPQGNYGAGAVIVWDRGTYTMIDPVVGSASAAVDKGKIDFVLHGFKLHGAFTLVRTDPRDAIRAAERQRWLLVKKRDEYIEDEDLLTSHPRSVLSGLTVSELRDSSTAGKALTDTLLRLKAARLQGPVDPHDFPLMLAKLSEHQVDGDQWLFELKYDGVRALAIRDGERTRLLARSGADITARYPEVVLAFNTLPYERFVMDGEIVALDEKGRPNFQLLQRRMHVQDKHQVARLSFSIPVHHFLFDILAFDGFDLRTLPLEHRKELLGHLIHRDGPLRYCEHVLTHGLAFYNEVTGAGLEGIIAKKRDSPYRGTRSGDWLKIKCPQTRQFVIGGYTDPAGTRTHFGALLLGMNDQNGKLRFTDKVGTGFNRDLLAKIHQLLKPLARTTSPFRRPGPDEPAPESGAHFTEPELVCEVRFSEWTNHGGIRHPAFLRLVPDADPRDCRYDGPEESEDAAIAPNGVDLGEPGSAIREAASNEVRNNRDQRQTDDRWVVTTHPDKVFWPKQGYTKGEMVEYYRAIAKWMLPYLADRPVMLTRFPDGIAGKSFYQKDAPAFAPRWIRTERVYSEDADREIDFFVIESEEALAYVANLAAITIHIWSSRTPHLERPDWLLFDIDPKGSTTANAVAVAKEVAKALKEIGMRPYLKTSGQMGLHVVVGLKPKYTYEQARMFSELVARLVVARVPDLATLVRSPHARNGKVYIDYLQLGHGKTIAAPFTIRAQDGAPVSAPLKWTEARTYLNPGDYNIKNMVGRMKRLASDPFIGALNDQMTLEEALATLETTVARSTAGSKA